MDECNASSECLPWHAHALHCTSYPVWGQCLLPPPPSDSCAKCGHIVATHSYTFSYDNEFQVRINIGLPSIISSPSHYPVLILSCSLLPPHACGYRSTQWIVCCVGMANTHRASCLMTHVDRRCTEENQWDSTLHNIQRILHNTDITFHNTLHARFCMFTAVKLQGIYYYPPKEISAL